MDYDKELEEFLKREAESNKNANREAQDSEGKLGVENVKPIPEQSPKPSIAGRLLNGLRNRGTAKTKKKKSLYSRLILWITLAPYIFYSALALLVASMFILIISPVIFDMKFDKDDTVTVEKPPENQPVEFPQQEIFPYKGKLVFPTREGYLTSPFGVRWGVMHKGIDVGSGRRHIPIYSAAPGVVKVSGFQPLHFNRYGNVVLVEHNIDGREKYTLYAHLHEIKVKVGQTVDQNTVVGLMGDTGDSTAIHLHFEVRNSMYGGHTDPLKYFNCTYSYHLSVNACFNNS